MPTHPLSVAIVTPTLSRSGGGIFPIVRAHARVLAQTGRVSPVVYGLWDAAADEDARTLAPVEPTIYRPSIPSFGYAPKMGDDIARANHDVLHQHALWMYPSVAGLRWRRRTGKPTVVSVQGMLEPWALRNSALKKRIAAALFERANLREAACIHCSQAEVAGVRAFGLSNPIAVLPNGVDLPAPSAPPPRPAWMHEGEKTLLFLGRLHPKKGIDELLQALSLIRSSAPAVFASWRVAIAGWDDGGHEAAMRARVRELSLDDRVTFTGPLFGEDKVAAFRHSQAFVLPSHSEGLPMAVLEAWSWSLPVLMTRECNLPEGFADGAAIEITTDPGAMAAVLAESLASPDLSRIGAKGRDLAAVRFSWKAIVEQLALTYEWLTGRGPRPSCILVD